MGFGGVGVGSRVMRVVCGTEGSPEASVHLFLKVLVKIKSCGEHNILRLGCEIINFYIIKCKKSGQKINALLIEI